MYKCTEHFISTKGKYYHYEDEISNDEHNDLNQIEKKKFVEYLEECYWERIKGKGGYKKRIFKHG